MARRSAEYDEGKGGTVDQTDETRDARGETAEAVYDRNQRCQGKRREREELNRGLGATSEEMVGLKNW